MPETLDFDVSVALPGFALAVAERVPLTGVTAITGPSGSGKTTLLRVLAGLETQASGTVTLAGDRIDLLPPHRRGIGFVFQEPRLFPHMSVADNLGYGARRRRGGPDMDGIIAALDLSPLIARRPAALSGGEARRVALGRALASNPRILFLDEPLTGLDAARKAEVLPHLMRATSGFGLPALLVTHAEDEILSLADRILRLRDGIHDGWAAPPIRLRGQVIETVDEGSRIGLGDTDVLVPHHLPPGATVALAIAEGGALISRDPPGPSTALAVLPAELCDGPEGPGLIVAGQRIAWPGGGRLSGPAETGRGCWLSLLRVHCRVEPDG